jgi:hypothetical protein
MSTKEKMFSRDKVRLRNPQRICVLLMNDAKFPHRDNCAKGEDYVQP